MKRPLKPRTAQTTTWHSTVLQARPGLPVGANYILVANHPYGGLSRISSGVGRRKRGRPLHFTFRSGYAIDVHSLGSAVAIDEHDLGSGIAIDMLDLGLG